jgi:uncharacterized caspase-like protein
MISAAVIVGINAYQNKPLTSAINDADAVRQALIKHQLVDATQIRMFTSPSRADSKEATKKNIKDELYDFYKNRDDVDRFFFFFAGHGILIDVKGDLRTVLMPVDVADLDRDADALIDLNEVLGFLRHGGPRQQLYFIDACRDLVPNVQPLSVGTLGWQSRKDIRPALAQATLYAVSELGKERSQVDGMGVMTSQLIEALDGEGVATDYDDSLGDWVVSMKSIAEQVKHAVGKTLETEPAWLRAYMMPQLDDPDPKTEPLRLLGNVNPKPLTINISPDLAESDTEVSLSLRSFRVKDYCLPPQKNHQSFDLPPQRYLVEATYKPDRSIIPIPNRKTIDVRRDRELEIVVPITGGPPPPSAPTVPTAGPAPDILFGTLSYLSPASPGTGMIRAKALEPEVAIELEALQHPYQKWSEFGSLFLQLPVGSYRVRFRLGTDVFNETEVYVKAGELVVALPRVAAPPLVREALQLQESLPSAAVVSESIGDIQAGLLQTMLPLIAIKPFDTQNEILHQFTGLIEPQSAQQSGMHPLSVVIAIDGDRWSDALPADILSSITCQTEVQTHVYEMRDDDGFSFTPVQEIGLRPLSRATLSDLAVTEPGTGFERVGLAISTAPAPSFTLLIKSPYLGEYQVACAAIHKRVTVVTLTFRPDAPVEISQNLLRLPGRSELYVDELVPQVPYARLIRELQLGQQLYNSGELIQQGIKGQLSTALRDLLSAKWTDPILSCMAFLGLRRLHPVMDPSFESTWMLETARNLNKYFSGLTDSKLIYGLAFPREQSLEFDRLLRFDRVPVLAESARILARYAAETGRENAVVASFARHMSVRQSLASIIRADEVRPSVVAGALSATKKTTKHTGAAGAS